jgi:predicted dehydrogenase
MLATHYLNLGPWILDSPIVEVAADGTNLMCPHIEGEDHMAALVRFAGGARGSIGSSWCVKGEYMSVHGAQGFASYVDNAVFTLRTAAQFEGEIVRYTAPGERLVLADLRPPAMGDWRNPFNQHRRFVDAVLDGGPPDMPGEAGLRDMKTLAAAYRALTAGGREKVAA